MKKIVSTKNAPSAIGAYSQGVIVDGGVQIHNNQPKLVFTAGQIPLDPKTGEMRNDTIEEATEQVLKNVRGVLEAAGSRMENVIKTTVFLQDMSEFAGMNEVYSRFFSENPPARSAVQAAALPKGSRVEIEAIATVSM